ncbi:MAG: hypothetical protein CVV10_07210 [Gammaproteobacteria bacterium HGW-Gammaproteobacteria-14]|nr:MAG: hypothetical protein CVV10_07210 [Gammaproteobacteria bacterium HGW-Gammaproteobacteria-14]
MNDTLKQLNAELLALAEDYSNAALGAAEFRRRRREIICHWTGQSAPSDPDNGPATLPATPIITVDESSAEENASAGKSSPLGLIILLLLVAVAGLASLLWFVLR